MAYKHGEMDISAQRQTFALFIRQLRRALILTFVILLLMAAFLT